MSTENTETQTYQKLKYKSKTDYVRIAKETKRKILSDLAKINRKDYGRIVTTTQYIELAISLLTPAHLEQLKSESLTNKDRLEQKYREFCSQNRKITMDELLGVLLKKE